MNEEFLKSENLTENFNISADSLSNIYKTASGRTVYGGGGITPDHLVSNKDLTNLSMELRRNNIYYQFIRKYMNKNSKRINELYDGDLREFQRSFKFTDEVMNEFIDFAVDKNIEYDEMQYLEDKQYIQTRLKAFVAREIWRNEGWYLTFLSEDAQFRKAIEISLSDVILDTVN